MKRDCNITTNGNGLQKMEIKIHGKTLIIETVIADYGIRFGLGTQVRITWEKTDPFFNHQYCSSDNRTDPSTTWSIQHKTRLLRKHFFHKEPEESWSDKTKISATIREIDLSKKSIGQEIIELVDEWIDYTEQIDLAFVDFI